jgi:hypothetical protein
MEVETIRIRGTVTVRPKRSIIPGLLLLGGCVAMAGYVVAGVEGHQPAPTLNDKLAAQQAEEQAQAERNAQLCDHASVAEMLRTEFYHHNCVELGLGTSERAAIARQIDASLR